MMMNRMLTMPHVYGRPNVSGIIGGHARFTPKEGFTPRSKIKKGVSDINQMGGAGGLRMAPVGRLGDLVKRGDIGRPIVKGKETGAKAVKQAKKYWIWICAAIVAYFILKK